MRSTSSALAERFSKISRYCVTLSYKNIVKFAFDVPEGFVDETGTGQYMSTTPGSIANIYIYAVENDGSFDMITEEVMYSALESELESAFGIDLDVEMPLFEEIEIDGRRAIRYAIEYEANGYQIIQKQYVMEDGEYFRYVSYTYTAGDECEAAFIASEDTIRFE